jgi:hypothetical protein
VVKAAFPGTKLTRPFVNIIRTGPMPLLGSAEAACRVSWNAGLIPVYSIRLRRDEVMAGRWDPYIRELADWHADQPPAELVIWHEPENDAEMRGGAFPAYFNRVAAVFRSVNEKVPLLYAAMAYQWLPGAVGGTVKGWTSTPADWQGVDCDRHMIDVYSGSSVPLDVILPEHRGLQRWMDLVVGDRTWGVAERGFITATDHQKRAVQIRRETDWLLADPGAQRCRRYIYWNTVGADGNPGLVLDELYGEPAVRDLVAALNS